MRNIILLGHKSSIGNSFYSAFKNKYNFVLIDKPTINANQKNSLKKIITKINIKKKYILINCIGMMGADKSKKEIDKFLRVNGIFPIEPIFLKNRINISKYIFLSSETIYGKGINKKENDSKKPMHPYSISKLFAEENIKKSIAITNFKDLKVTILRIPVVIFQKQKFQNTLTAIYNDYKNSDKITIFGNGKHLRKYIYFSDLNYLINKIVKKNQNKNIEIFNVPGVEASSIQIKEIIQKILKIRKPLNFIKSNKSFSLTSNSKKFEKDFGNTKIKNLYQIINHYNQVK